MQSLHVLRESLVFAGLSLLLVFLPGFALARGLRLPTDTIIERLFIAGVLGFCSLTLSLLVLGPLDPRLILLLPIVAGAYLWRRPLRPFRALRSLRGEDVLVLACCGVAVLSAKERLRYWSEVDGGFAVTAYYDHFVHTGVLGELLREIPVRLAPFVAGEPFWPYHPNTNLFAFAFVRFGGLHPIDTHLVYLHAFAWLLCALGIAAVMRRWTGSVVGIALGLVLYFTPVYTQAEALRVQFNSPTLLALPLFLAAVWAVTVDCVQPKRSCFLIASVAVAALFATKANLFLAFAPAFALYALYALKEGRFADVSLATLLGALVIAKPLYLHLAHPMARGVGFEFGRYAAYLADGEGGVWARAISLGPIVGSFAVVTLWLVSLAKLWTLPALFAIVRGFVQSSRPVRVRSAVAFGATAFGVFGVCLFPTEAGARQFEAWNTASFLAHPVNLIAILAAAAGIHHVGQAAWRALEVRGQTTVRLPLVYAGLLAVQISAAAVALAHGNPERPAFFARAWVHAMEALRERSPLDARIATALMPLGGTYTSGFSLRAVLVERAVQMGVYYPSVPLRLADLDLAWRTVDFEILRSVMLPYGITHLVETADRPIASLRGFDRGSDGSRGLRLFFAEDDVTVWELPPFGQTIAIPDPLARQRREAASRYRAVLDVLEGLDPGGVASRLGVARETLETWIERTRQRRSILDEPWLS